MVVVLFTYVDYERMHLMLSNFLIFRDGSEWSVELGSRALEIRSYVMGFSFLRGWGK